MKLNPQHFHLERISYYYHRRSGHPCPIQIDRGGAYVELLTAGRGWIWDEGQWREVTTGYLLWNGPGTETIGRSDASHPYQCLAIMLRARKTPPGIPRISICKDASAVNDFTGEVLKLFLDATVDREILCQYVLGRILLWMHRHALSKGRADLPEGLQDALGWIETRYARPCPVARIAKAAGWSSAYLHRMFREHLAATPHQILRQRRLRAAREALAMTTQPIKRLAVECGFADASALVHAFRASLGTTPKAYRLQHAGMVAGRLKSGEG